MFKWIEKKDLFYWLFFVIMIYLLSSDIGQYDRFLLDNWAFAGTIVSIILAVIAILYTFDQSSTTVASTKKLEESANRVEEATKELEDNNISTVITALEERLNTLLQDMQKDLHKNITTNFEPLKSFMNLQKDSSNQDKTIQVLTDEEWQNYLNSSIVQDQLIEGMTLIYAYFLYENDLGIAPSDVRKWFKSLGKNDEEVNVYMNFIFAQLRLFASFNVVTYESNEKLGKITNINPVVHSEITRILEEPNESVTKVLTALKGAFGIK